MTKASPDSSQPLSVFASRVKRKIAWEAEKIGIRRRLAAQVSMPSYASGEEVILFFSPEAGIAAHFAAQCVLARTLQERGHRVLFTRCFQLFARCPVMDMYQLPYTLTPTDKGSPCLRCAKASMDMLDAYGLPHLDLRTFETDEMRAQVAHALDYAPADLREFEYNGVPFGKLSGHDLILARKIHDLSQVEAEDKLAWRKYIETGIASYLLIGAICESLNIGQIVYHNDYAMMLGARLAGQKRGIPSYCVSHAAHINIDRRRYVIRAEMGREMAAEQGRDWPKWRDLPLSESQIETVADDLMTRLKAIGSHRYSPAKTQTRDIRADLGLSPNKKLLVAYTSSLDEYVASEMNSDALGLHLERPAQPFEDQIAWLKALTAWVDSGTDYQLVVRVHPREGANKRESRISQHLIRLKEIFGETSPNWRFVWPEQPISSYDLAEAADVALISWSTIGSELARFGVPVLASTHGIDAFPQDDFLEWGATPEEYFRQLQTLLRRAPTLGTLQHAFRWHYFYYLGGSVDLGDVIPDSHFADLPRFHLPREAHIVEEIVIQGQNILDINLRQMQAWQCPDSAARERAALQQQLRRLVHFLFTGEDKSGTWELGCLVTTQEPADFLRGAPQRDRIPVLLLNGAQAHYLTDSGVYSKYSPMCARLGLLGATSGTDI